MSGHILTLNAGSSSLKFAVYARDGLRVAAVGSLDGLGTDPALRIVDGEGHVLVDDALEGASAVPDHAAALTRILSALESAVPGGDIRGIGHRVVHGGPEFAAPIPVADDVLRRIEGLVPLAPLHQPHNVAGIRAARRAFPHAPQVACFDTAFHRGHDFVHDAYALPLDLYEGGIRRYGFHGLSYEYISGRLAEIDPAIAAGRVVVCHLGSGASMCAMKSGRSVSSTMGFTALDGLPMGTRPGRLDPGVLLHLLSEKGYDAASLTTLLYHQSGLKGLSGISNDMRELEASGDPRALHAIAYFAARIREEIGAMAAILGGLDALVFTAGIGENARQLRAAVLASMDWLGMSLDEARNAANGPLISSDRSQVRVYVLRTDEELMIARHTAALL